MTWIIGIIWVIGNIALFSGSFEVLPLLSILALIGDIFVIVYIIKGISARSSQAPAPSPTRTNQTQTLRRETSTTYPNTKTLTTANEDNSKLSQLKSKYHVQSPPLDCISVDPLQREMESFQCVEVVQSVKKAVSKRKAYAQKMKLLKEEIDGILTCPGCSTDREKVKYIKNNETLLQQKKEAYITASKEMQQTRVILLAKEISTFTRLFSSLSDIVSSTKKESVNQVELSNFMTLRSTIPGNLFISEQAPIELNYGAYKFFLLPDVVLAYDKTNTFVTAFEPMAFVIKIQDREKYVFSRRDAGGSWSFSDNIIARDSILIAEGNTKTSWMHERISGGPDLRYSYNPRYESRTDTYAYSYFSIQIGQYKAEYLLSKAYLAKKLSPLVQGYCSIMHDLNAIPSLLRLVESVAKKEETARLLSEQYESINKNTICKVS